MRMVSARPHPALRDVVGGYVEFADTPGRVTETAEAPGRGIVVIVDLDSGWTVEGDRVRSFAGGLYARPVRVRHEGTCAGVQFDLEPTFARAVLGVPAGELSHVTVGLEDLLGRDAARLAERLHGAEDRFAALDAFLLRALARHEPEPDVERAWSLLRASGGRVRVEAMAGALGCSRRHLARRFAAEVGVSPKTAARLVRFQAARSRLGTIPLARLAAEHGYADQAHLSREFAALAGAPPTEVPFLQDAASAAA